MLNQQDHEIPHQKMRIACFHKIENVGHLLIKKKGKKKT